MTKANSLISRRSKYVLPIPPKRGCNNHRLFFQVQELSSEIPAGSMPRTIDIVLRGEIVELAKPGQMVSFSGTLIVVPDVAQMNSVGDRSEVVREAGPRRCVLATLPPKLPILQQH